MMKKNWTWISLLIGFAALHVYAYSTGTLDGLLALLSNPGPWGILLMVDLVIALTIGVTWMWRDARRREVSPWPYLALTLATGSLGLLAYLVRFGMSGRRARQAASGARPVRSIA